MSLNNKPNIIPSGTVMNTTIYGLPCSLQTLYNFSLQIVFTGTPTGSFKLQMSDDPYPNNAVTNPPTNWTDIANSSQSVTEAGNVGWDYSLAGFNWVRVVYTDDSSGSSTATITSAMFNGK